MELNKAIFESFPVLRTKRLILREIQLRDAQEIFAMRASGRVNQFIPRPNMQNPIAARELVERTQQAFKNQQAIGWAGVLLEKEEIIGTCGFNMIDYANLRAEIGGELAVSYWGKQLAIEAVSAILQFGFTTMNLHTIEAKVSPNNRGAIYLMETLGFRKEAHFVDRIYFENSFSDMAVYTLIRGNETFSNEENT